MQSAKTNVQMVLFSSALGQYQLLESYLELCCQDDHDGTFVFETHRRSTKSGTNNETPIFKQLYIALSATQKAWEHTLTLTVVDGTFMKAHIFDQMSCWQWPLTAITIDTEPQSVLLLVFSYCSMVQ